MSAASIMITFVTTLAILVGGIVAIFLAIALLGMTQEVLLSRKIEREFNRLNEDRLHWATKGEDVVCVHLHTRFACVDHDANGGPCVYEATPLFFQSREELLTALCRAKNLEELVAVHSRILRP